MAGRALEFTHRFAEKVPGVLTMNAGITASMLSVTLVLLIQVAWAEDTALWDTDDQTIVKRSRNNICHDKDDPSFEQTVHFRAYRTIKDCLDSGGKLPRN